MNGPDPIFADVQCLDCGTIWNVRGGTEDEALGGTR